VVDGLTVLFDGIVFVREDLDAVRVRPPQYGVRAERSLRSMRAGDVDAKFDEGEDITEHLGLPA